MSKRTIDPTNVTDQWEAARINLARVWWTRAKFTAKYSNDQADWAHEFELAADAKMISLEGIEDCLVDEIKAQR